MHTLDSTLDFTFGTLDRHQLDSVAGGTDWGRVWSSAERVGTAGTLLGGGIGTAIGAAAGGIPTAGIGALPGAALGGGFGATLGGGLGYVGGAAASLWNQARGR